MEGGTTMYKTELKKWLKENNIKISDFAKRLGIHRTYLSDIVNGHETPSWTLARLIEYETNGEIKAESFFEKEPAGAAK